MPKYSAMNLVKHIIWLLRTRIFFRPARLVRFPIDLRGNCGIRYGAGFTTGRNCRLETFSTSRKDIFLKLGRNVQLNDNVHIVAAQNVTIGNDVLIASKVFISDCSHGVYTGSVVSSPMTSPAMRKIVSSPVTIGDRVWLGENVVVLQGVTIGDGCVIGASSLVTKDIPPNSIAFGIPATVVKQFDFSSGTWLSVESK